MPNGQKPPREPMFNLPLGIQVLGGVMILIQVLQDFVFSRVEWEQIMLTFSFIPLRYSEAGAAFSFPGGVGGDVWTFVTYAFLHGGWMHLLLNLLWMAAFATVVWRRIGAYNFALFFVITAAAGALVHLLIHAGSGTPLVGVSAVLSGAMAATARFAFSHGGLAGFSFLQGRHRARCLTLSELRYNQQAMMFLGIWLVLNLVFGLTAVVGGGASIAWEAHLGGFIAGLLVFPFLDPYSRPPKGPKQPKTNKKKSRLRLVDPSGD